MKLPSKLALTIATHLALVVPANATTLLDGSFENQAVSQENPFYLQSDGSKWGAAWSNWGWSSWQNNFAGAWTGGAIARTEDFTTGWKWARTGDVMGIIKDRQTMSQSFLATEDAIGTLSWFDSNRNSWREHTWFGRQNEYNVTLVDNFGNTQLIGSYTSEVFLGLDSNSWTNAPDDRFTLAGKQGWFARTGISFTLISGRTYTLNFNSLSPFVYDSFGNLTGVDDRTTLLDDITLTTTAVPEPASIVALGIGLLSILRKRTVVRA